MNQSASRSPPGPAVSDQAVLESERSALRQRFISGMSHAASTVSVITTDGPAGRAGVTISSMTSVSVDTPKPTLLACVHQLSPAAPRILENGVFCVNLLRNDQSYISDVFAGRLKPSTGDKFDCAEWIPQKTGSPRLVDPLVAFDSRLISHQQFGTHFVFVGEVEDVFIASGGSSLVYANRAYGRTTIVESVGSISDGVQQQQRQLRIGCFHTFGPYVVPRLITRMREEAPFTLTLVEGDQIRILQSLGAGEIDVALIYDFEIGETFSTEPLASLPPYVLLAEDSGLATRPALSLSELAKEPLILLETPPSSSYFLSLFADAGIQPNIRCRIPSLEMVRALVGRGFGYALLSTDPAPNISHDGCPLVTRPLSQTVPGSTVVLARRRGDRLQGPCAIFADYCREYFANS